MLKRRMLALVSLAALLVLSACTPAAQRSGPLEMRLTEAGPPGGASVVPPAGLEWLRCSLDITNTSETTQTVDYQAGQLALFDGHKAVPARGGTGSTAEDAGHKMIFSRVPALPGGGAVAVYRNFLVTPDQRNLTLVYRLPGYPDHTWKVR